MGCICLTIFLVHSVYIAPLEGGKMNKQKEKMRATPRTVWHGYSPPHIRTKYARFMLPSLIEILFSAL